MMPAHRIYADRLVAITEDSIRFENYYFPFGSRRVPFSDVDSITAETPNWFNGRFRLHGSGDLRTWFPRDWRRPSRPAIFFVRLHGSTRRIGFTVEDTGQVTQILRDKGLLTPAPTVSRK